MSQRALLALAAAAVLAGCTPPLDHVDSHPDLDHETLRDGGVVVLPAVSFVDVHPLEGQELLMSNVHSWREQIAIDTNDSAEAEAIIDAVAAGRAIPREAVADVADASGRRFVAVVVLHDYTTHFTEIHDTIIDDGVAYTQTTLEAEGNLDGELRLIESRTGETWWHGDHAETDYERVVYDDTDWFIPGPPDPPTAYALTDDLLEAMVRNWPREN